MNSKTGGMIGAGCAALMLMSSLASVLLLFYLGFIESRNVSEEEAAPGIGAGCCCSITSLILFGVGIYFAVRKPPAPPSPPSM